MTAIPLKIFKTLCESGQMYEGEVEGLGYVYWKPKYMNAPVAGLPSQTVYNTPRNAQFVMDMYEMVIIKKNNNTVEDSDKFNLLANTGVNAVTLYGIGKTFQSASTRPITIGSKYIPINPQGTLVHNPGRIYTTSGKIAASIGKKVFFASLVIDPVLAAAGQQSWEKAGVNMAVNTGIFFIGVACPPAGAVLGIAWFLINLSAGNHVPSLGSYEEIHGTTVPADNTRVVRPHIEELRILKRTRPVYPLKQYYFEQGRPKY